MRVFMIALTGSMALASGWARADDIGHRFDVTPFVGFRGGGEFEATDETKPNVEPTWSYGLSLGYSTYGNTRYELFYSRQRSEIEHSGGFDFKVEHLHAGATASFEPGWTFIPFISVGIGATRFSPQSGDSLTRLSASLGFGTNAMLSERVRLRLEARGYLVSMDPDSTVFCTSANCMGPSGGTLMQWELLAGVGFTF